MKKMTNYPLFSTVLAAACLVIAGYPAPESSPTVYTAGSYSNGSISIPCYWTGTTKTDLPGDGTGTHNSRAYSIFVQ